MTQEPGTTRTTAQSSVLTPQSFFRSPQSSLLLTASAGVLIAAALCAVGRYREAAGAALLLPAVGFVAIARVSVSTILVVWFVASPVASFFIRFPYDKSVITFNRAVFALIAGLLLIR